MDCRKIEQLLERYWQCETSLEEEVLLREFFSQEEIPASLCAYKDLFAYQQTQQQVGLGEDFDVRMLAKVEPRVVKARRLTWRKRLMPLFKSAAMIALILTLGNVAEQSFFRGDGSVLTTDTIGQQVTIPSVAFSKDLKADPILSDSLVQVKETKTVRHE